MAGLAAVYYAAARFGLGYAAIGRSISLIWPPTGVALAALTLLGLRAWPGVTIGALFANLATPLPAAAALAIAIGNTLEALLGAALLRRIAGPRPALESPRVMRGLVLAAAPSGALVSALLGVTALGLTGALPTPRATAIAVWWTGDLLGALVVAPCVFAWALGPAPRRGARGIAEVALLGLGTVVVAELLLGQAVHLPVLRRLDYLYLLFPFVIWAALRFGVRGASLTTLAVAVIAAWHTTRGGGPFIEPTGPGTQFAAACYLAAVAITGLVLASVVAHERGTAADTIEHREAQLQVALDAARMGTWSWNAAEDRVVWDDAMRRLYHLPPGEPVATYADFIRRVHPDDREFVAAAVGRAIGQRGRLDFEFRTVLSDGRTRWIANQGRVLVGADGTVTGLTGVSSDVTERRMAEEQLRQAHRIESIGRLAGGVAHEANNQMSVVIGTVDFIRRRADLHPELRSDIEQISRAAERTAAVTAQLLAFSRRQVRKPVALDLNEVLRRFLPVLRRAMGEDCRVTLRLDPALAPVLADPGQVEQVVLNLALNARDAMPAGGELTLESFGAEVTEGEAPVTPSVSIRPGRYIGLAVHDTGEGMDRVTLAHIFEPFFTTKPVGRGSGLGLSTVYGIVKQSGGYVWATSAPGRGTTFRIYLPVVPERPAAARPSGGTPRLDGMEARGELVLVVEDEEQVRRVAARALADAGYRVLEAANGREALSQLSRASDQVALVLTDVVMPEMSGHELADRVTDLRPGTPVLFTSGHTDGEMLRRGLGPAGPDLLTKPFAPDAVVRAVRERLARAAGGTARS